MFEKIGIFIKTMLFILTDIFILTLIHNCISLFCFNFCYGKCPLIFNQWCTGIDLHRLLKADCAHLFLMCIQWLHIGSLELNMVEILPPQKSVNATHFGISSNYHPLILEILLLNICHVTECNLYDQKIFDFLKTKYSRVVTPQYPSIHCHLRSV